MITTRRLVLVAAALIVLAVLAIYGWTVGFDFVFDDHVQIERNPWLRDPAGVRLFFTEFEPPVRCMPMKGSM